MDTYYNSERNDIADYLNLTSGMKILDVGCGAGNFGKKLIKGSGVEVWGIEKNEEIAKVAETNLTQVIVGDVANAIPNLPEANFDYICFNDSLEHFENPEYVLKCIGKKLTENGKIMCSVPNIRYFRVMWSLLFKKEFDYTDAGILDRTHLRLFTINSIEKLFLHCGYRIDFIRGNCEEKASQSKSWKPRIFQLITFGKASDMYSSQIHVCASLSRSK